jgi:ATP-binding cassette subfamily B protein
MASRQTETKGDIKRVYRHIVRYKKHFAAGAVAILLTNAFGMVAPWLIKDAIEMLEGGTATSARLLNYALAVIAVSLLSGFFLYFLRRTIIWASRYIEYDIRNEITSKLLGLPRSYYNVTPTGDIIVRLSSDVEAVRMMIGPGIMQFSNTIVAGSIAIALMFILSPTLTLVALLPFPILAYTFKKVAFRVYSLAFQIQNHFSTMSAFVQENIAGVRIVRSYNQESSQTSEFESLNKDYIGLNLKLAKLQGLFQPVVMLEVGVILLVVLYFGGIQVINGSLTLGVLVAFLLYLMMLVWPVMAIGWTITLYQRGMASQKRIDAILDIIPDVRDSEQVSEATNLKPEIEFRNLSFAYPGTARTILKDVTLSVPAGKTTAFVGRTGCGKSTLLDLMMRAYRVEDGVLLIGGRDINSIPLSQLRRFIGYVPQESFLFSDTLYENISFGLQEVNRERSETSASLAKLSGDIAEFPNRFETLVGERGITLSGGQKQRAALARALARDPQILILDDAFSAVDTSTEEQILTGIESVVKSRTTIIVSHRVSTVKRADLIHVLDGGRVIDSGSHGELLERCELYADIVSRQELEEQLEQL